MAVEGRETGEGWERDIVGVLSLSGLTKLFSIKAKLPMSLAFSASGAHTLLPAISRRPLGVHSPLTPQPRLYSQTFIVQRLQTNI